MKTITIHNLKRSFPATRSVISERFLRSQGWLTNGYFAIKEGFEPKFSKRYRYEDSEIKFNTVLDKAIIKLRSRDTVFYEDAVIVNHFEVTFYKTFLVKLKSEHFECWVNPRQLTYVLEGIYLIPDAKIMIGKDDGNPILVTDSEKEVLGMVMPFRNNNED